MRVIIDAYNVIRTDPEGSSIESTRGNQAAQDWFFNLCKRTLKKGDQWFIVFDGEGIGTEKNVHGANIIIRYAFPLSADELIRELGEDAASMHIHARIVSSDNAVRVDGCEHQKSSVFMHHLRRKRKRQDNKQGKLKPPSKAEVADTIIKTLREEGFIVQHTAIDHQIKERLVEFVSYLYKSRQKPQKMARELEKYLKAHLPIQPDSDPHKRLLRAMKSLFH